MLSKGIYFAVSMLLAAIATHNASQLRPFLYPTIDQLTKSSFGILSYLNLLVAVMIAFHNFLGYVFLGSLRESEREAVRERIGFALTEAFLSLAVFQYEVGLQHIIVMIMVLFIKSMTWACQERLKFIQQVPDPDAWKHLRFISLIGLLSMVSLWSLYICLETLVEHGHSIVLLFCLEFCLLSIKCMVIYCKYILAMLEIFMENQLEIHRVLVFYLDFFSDLAKLMLMATFFVAISTFYGMPIHIIREFYMTTRAIYIRIRDFIHYRRLIANFDERFEDATAEELATADRTCIICRDEMDSAKKLPCGHMFHAHCLRQWMEQNQLCPTCRRPMHQHRPRRHQIRAQVRRILRDRINQIAREQMEQRNQIPGQHQHHHQHQHQYHQFNPYTLHQVLNQMNQVTPQQEAPIQNQASHMDYLIAALEYHVKSSQAIIQQIHQIQANEAAQTTPAPQNPNPQPQLRVEGMD